MNVRGLFRRRRPASRGSVRFGRRSARLSLEALDERCLLSTIFVSTIQDNGNNANPTPGSLRAAIIQANSSAQPTTIDFSLGAGVFDLKVAAPLPDVTANHVTIDGGNDPQTIIELDGVLAGNVTGLSLKGNNCAVNGLTIVRFGSSGILVEGVGDSITSCEIGTDEHETAGLGNGIGVYVFQTNDVTLSSDHIEYNTADGVQAVASGGIAITATSLERNTDDGIRILGGHMTPSETFVVSISSGEIDENGSNGVHIVSSSHNIIGPQNIIGDDEQGEPDEGNRGDGVLIESSEDSSASFNTVIGNDIGGNGGNGVRLTGPGTSHNSVTQNCIGMTKKDEPDAPNTLVVSGNALDGVVIADGANHNTIGGQGLGPGTGGNAIAANRGNGIRISDPGTSRNVVEGNQIGWAKLTSSVAGGNGANGILINNGASQNVVGGGGGTVANTGFGNLISANTLSGIDLSDPGTSNNLVDGNLIGADVTGTASLGNLTGVMVEFGASNNHIGDALNFAGRTRGNVISGNTNLGVLVVGKGTTGNSIRSNEIGTNLAGDTAIPNGGSGMLIALSASGNVVGGPDRVLTNFLAGNIISGNTLSGVEIATAGTTKNVLEGNLIGTDATGSKALPNALNGVLVSLSASGNSIGGSIAGLGNTISGNTLAGVVINQLADGNVVQNNAIGANLNAFGPLGNGQDGVDLQSNNNTVTGNAISGNLADGIVVNGSGNNIAGNDIGTGFSGAVAIPNHQDGVAMNITIGPGGNTLGGTTKGDGNVISGNLGNGLNVSGPASLGNLIEGNEIGTSGFGEQGVANFKDGILINNTTGYTIGGGTPQARNLISGNLRNGIEINGPATTNIAVVGNKIGTDSDGKFPIGNILNGVVIRNGASNNRIGGASPNQGNLISGNHANGVLIVGAIDSLNAGLQTANNQVLGNLIGTNVSGKTAVPNLGHGVEIQNAASNSIGGAVGGAGNLISGNAHDGVQITGGSQSNSIQGNMIGLASDGTHALANGNDGVEILQGSSNTIIGGVPTATSTPGNVISGNTGSGIAISGAGTKLNFVEGNFIGTTRNGGAPRGNLQDGVDILSGASNNQVGAAGKGGNFISGNAGDGVRIAGAGTNQNFLRGNSIGTYTSGLTGKGNGGHGVWVLQGAQQNLIGETAASANVIAYNALAGVAIGQNAADKTTVSDAVLYNSIFGNAGLGIDLGNDGVTLNTPGSPHVGPNNFLSTPEFVSAAYDGVSATVVRLTLNAAPSSTFLIQVFANPAADPSGHGQGQTLIATKTVSTDATGNLVGGFVDISIPGSFAGRFLSATATDTSGDTSEFAKDFRAK